jgi:Flp pilus assembly protein protease CpaA
MNLLVFLAAVWLIAATITDLKRREIPNWLSFSLLALALGTITAESVLEWKFQPILYAALWTGIFFVLGNALYYGKIFAGGDAKLLTALGPFFSSFSLASDFFLNTLIIAGVYGLAWSAGLALVHKKAFKSEIKARSKKTVVFRAAGLILAFVFLVASFFTKIKELSIAGLVVMVFPYLYTFIKTVENACLIKKVSPQKLTEGDWLVADVKIGKRAVKAKFSGLTPQEIRLLRKSKRQVLIKQGIPFVPVFLISFIVTIFLGNLFVIIQGIL